MNVQQIVPLHIHHNDRNIIPVNAGKTERTAKEIPVQSWRRFSRLIHNSIGDDIFVNSKSDSDRRKGRVGMLLFRLTPIWIQIFDIFKRKFSGDMSWDDFKGKLKEFVNAGKTERTAKEIPVQSWRRFSRLIAVSLDTVMDGASKLLC